MFVRCSFSIIVVAHGLTSFAQADKPLPEVKELQARAVANYAKLEKDGERYLCTERIENDELNGIEWEGQVKKRTMRERELFYVNGFAISRN